ncbi:hypothetical protein DL98DRAFT_209485 [Cadophora sp. DSE1049]|nr:hypothetical protein DL98DRAFT_209485 [Cadophora sp. DSE1049]
MAQLFPCSQCQQRTNPTSRCPTHAHGRHRSYSPLRSHTSIMINSLEVVQEQDEDQGQDHELSGDDVFTVESVNDDNYRSLSFYRHDHRNLHHYPTGHHNRLPHRLRSASANRTGNHNRHSGQHPRMIEHDRQPGVWVPINSETLRNVI